MATITDTKIMYGAEPFYFAGDKKIGCLCSHGLGASPQEVYWLGKYLAERGATVYGPRLHAHGISPEHMRGMRWREWYMSFLDGYHILRQQCDHVFALGLSMGGVLSLRLAENEQLDGIVPIAAPLVLDAKNLWLAHVLRYVINYTTIYDRSQDPLNKSIETIQRERGERVTGRVSYYRTSPAAVAELLKLAADVTPNLNKITAPTLLIYSEGDKTVPMRNADLIKAGLTNAKEVTIKRFVNSDHILTNDVDHEQVFAEAWAFIQRIVAQK